MNAHSTRFRTSEGFGRTEAPGFLKGSCTKVVKSASIRGRCDAELCVVLTLIPQEPSYGDGGILYHGWGGGGSASLWRRSVFGGCAWARFVAWWFSSWHRRRLGAH